MSTGGPVCGCNSQAVVNVGRRGKNAGRHYYTCHKFQTGDTCGFFQFFTEDEEARSRPAPPRHPSPTPVVLSDDIPVDTVACSAPADAERPEEGVIELKRPREGPEEESFVLNMNKLKRCYLGAQEAVVELQRCLWGVSDAIGHFK